MKIFNENRGKIELNVSLVTGNDSALDFVSFSTSDQGYFNIDLQR